MKRPFLTAEWRKLAMINYAVDPDILSPYIPHRTELDLWNDKCFVSLVGFRFLNTKLKGVPVPFHRNFEEINLRFYVRYKQEGKWKRGVTFIKEIVPRSALTFVANALYAENYITLPTKHSWINSENSLEVSYSWKHDQDWDSILLRVERSPAEIKPGSEEEFITEHFWGYTQIGASLTSEYEVVHPRWLTYPVADHKILVRFGDLYGAEFGKLKDAIPDSVMLAEGSEIAVLAATKIR